MKGLPNRSNNIYEEIENFKEYEYTYCIAYEMSIRNDDVQHILNNVSVMINTNSKYNENIIKLEEKYYINIDVIENIRMQVLKELEKEYEEFKSITLYFTEYNIFRNKEGYYNHLEKYTRLFDEYNSQIKSKYLNLQYLDFYFYKYLNEDEKIHNNHHGRLIMDLDMPKNEVCKNIFPMFEKKNYLRFSRPRLTVPRIIDKTTDLKINFSLPIEELIAYITKIKEDYDADNSIIKNSLELLGDELDKSDEMKSKALPKDKVKRKKTMADAFYIYDTWKILEIEYAEKTKELKEKLEKDIQDIKHNLNYDKYDKKSKIEDLKINNDFNLSNYTKVSLKTEIANRLNISIDTVDKLHTLMIKYIDNLKYKELITGLSN